MLDAWINFEPKSLNYKIISSKVYKFSRVSGIDFYNQLISGETSMNDATVRLKTLMRT